MESAFSDLINTHLDGYVKTSKACCHRLGAIWKDIGLSGEDQRKELQDTAARAQNVWNDTVELAEERRAAVRQKIEEALRETHKIKEQLGDDNCSQDDDPVSPGPGYTLIGYYEECKQKLEIWRQKKAIRVKEYEGTQSAVRALKSQLGFAYGSTPKSVAKSDISRATMEFLKLEIEKLQAEKERRLERMEIHLNKLRKLCQLLGEDEGMMVAEVHHTLRYFREAKGAALGEIFRFASKLQGQQGGQPLEVDLSDNTFFGIDSKITELEKMQADRESNASALLEVLESLWNALDVVPSDMHCSLYLDLMASPVRLHKRSIEKCEAEVQRLEGCKAQLMRDLIIAKAQEISAVCKATRLIEPDLSPIIGDLHSRDITSTGQTGEILAKLVRALSEAQAVADKRANLVALTNELEEARNESAWLHEFEQDPNRYKSRETTKNLARSNHAVKLRAKIPALMEQIREMLRTWSIREGPFHVDGQEYAHLLDCYEAEMQQQEDEKTAAKNAKKQAKSTPSNAGPAQKARGGPQPSTSGAASNPSRPGTAMSMMSMNRPAASSNSSWAQQKQQPKVEPKQQQAKPKAAAPQPITRTPAKQPVERPQTMHTPPPLMLSGIPRPPASGQNKLATFTPKFSMTKPSASASKAHMDQDFGSRMSSMGPSRLQYSPGQADSSGVRSSVDYSSQHPVELCSPRCSVEYSRSLKIQEISDWKDAQQVSSPSCITQAPFDPDQDTATSRDTEQVRDSHEFKSSRKPARGLFVNDVQILKVEHAPEAKLPRPSSV